MLKRRELIIEIPDVHVGNIGLIGIHAKGRGLGAVEAAAQYGYGLYSMRFSAGLISNCRINC